MIFELLQAREYVGGGGAGLDQALHARQVTNIILGTSSEHGGCYLAIRYGLARANAGHVSVQKLAKVTSLPRKRCAEIIDDMRAIVLRAGGL